MSEAIEAVLHRHRELLLRTDVRAYPSRSFKQGASWQHLEPMSDLIVDLVNTGKLLQTQVEKAIDKLDISMKGAIKMLVKRTSLVYDAYKKDLAFVLRLMAAHLLMKRQAWADSKKLGRTPRSHPEWAIQAYLNITEASSTMSADLASLSSSASTASQHSSTSTADANIRAMILAGRDAGVAFFPGFSDTLGDDEEDGIEEDDEDQGQDNEHISCKYWDPKLKKAVAVMQNGMIKYSSKFEAGPNGFVLAMWKADLEIVPLELEITNNNVKSLEVPVVDPGVFKRPAKAQSKVSTGRVLKRPHGAHDDAAETGNNSNKKIKKLLYSKVYHKTMKENRLLPIEECKVHARAMAASAVAALP